MSAKTTPVRAAKTTYRRPTHDRSTSQIGSESDKSSKVRRANRSSSIPLEIRRILSDTDTDYVNVTSNMRRAADRAIVRQTALRVHCHQLLKQPGARAADNSGGRIPAPPALKKCDDSLADWILRSAVIPGAADDAWLHFAYRKLQRCTSDKVYVRNVVKTSFKFRC